LTPKIGKTLRGKYAAMAGYRKAAQLASAALPVNDLTIPILKRPVSFLPR
jgi:hypothetical protein